MLFTYELKKIWRRVSPLLVIIVLALTTVATMLITTIFFNQVPEQASDFRSEYAALQTKIENWNNSFSRETFASTFKKFYADYKSMNTYVMFDSDKLVDKYNIARSSFLGFYLDFYEHYNIKDNINDYLLVNKKYAKFFNDILIQLDNFFSIDNPDNKKIINGLKYTNPQWEDANLQNILDNLFFVQEIKSEELTYLKAFFSSYPANLPNYDYTAAYNYAINRFQIAVATTSKYEDNLSQYEGFSNYQNVAASLRACNLAKYQIEHPNEEFAAPFTFGIIYNNSQQISLLDFVFTNLEMAMIPLTLLIIVWAACTFFTDNYQNTLITPVAAGKRRTTIILTKTTVILTLTVLSLLILIGIYVVSGLLFFNAYLSPDILFLFNDTTVMTMSAINYFTVYFLNLIFKLLPLIAICGLFSFVKNQPFIIAGLTGLICIVVIAANFLLGRFWFYQFVPLMGLDPIRYFGAQLMLAPMPETFNLWYTFPAMAAITVILYGTLIHIFRHHDF